MRKSNLVSLRNRKREHNILRCVQDKKSFNIIK